VEFWLGRRLAERDYWYRPVLSHFLEGTRVSVVVRASRGLARNSPLWLVVLFPSIVPFTALSRICHTTDCSGGSLARRVLRAVFER